MMLMLSDQLDALGRAAMRRICFNCARVIAEAMVTSTPRDDEGLSIAACANVLRWMLGIPLAVLCTCIELAIATVACNCIQCNALSCKQVHSRSFAPTVELSAAINSSMRGRCQRRLAGIKLATLPCCTCLHTPHPLVGRAAGWLGGHLACHRRHKAGTCMRKTCTQLALAYLCFHSDWVDLLLGRGGSQTRFNAIQDL